MMGCRRAWVSLVCKITISVRAACAKAAAERHTTSASTNKFRNRRNTFSSSQARIFPGTLILNLPIYRWQGKQQPPAGPATCAAKTAKAAGRGACGRCEANPRGCKVGYQGLPFLRRTSAPLPAIADLAGIRAAYGAATVAHVAVTVMALASAQQADSPPEVRRAFPLVPRAGIEPATPGFSVPCSTN